MCRYMYVPLKEKIRYDVKELARITIIAQCTPQENDLEQA